MIEKTNDKPRENRKGCMRIKFSSDGNLPLNERLKLHNLNIVARSVFQEKNEYYPQTFLDYCLFELKKCCNMKKMISQKELALINQINQKLA